MSKSKKKGLGRGLTALFGDQKASEKKNLNWLRTALGKKRVFGNKFAYNRHNAINFKNIMFRSYRHCNKLDIHVKKNIIWIYFSKTTL